MLEGIRKKAECDMDKFGTLYGIEKMVAMLRYVMATCGQIRRGTDKQTCLCNLRKKRNERPNLEGV